MNHNIILKNDNDHDQKELVIREGDALPVFYPEMVVIEGTIDSVQIWIEHKSEKIDFLESHILVNRAKRIITLFTDEKTKHGDRICGKLDFSPEFKLFGINNGSFRTPSEMAEFIKMNRSLFENRSSAMNLVTILQNFKAKVNAEHEKSFNPKNGDTKTVFTRVVESNTPDEFKINVPVFNGAEPVIISVELYFRPDDLTCCLISPHVNDYIHDTKNNMIDAEIEKIKLLSNNKLAIINF